MGTISATVDTATLKGLVGKTIDVTTNDPEKPSFRLAIRVRVTSGVELLPDERLFLHDRRPGATTVRRIVRRDPSAAGELALTDVRVDADWLRVDARRLDAPMAPTPALPDGGRPGDWLLEIAVDGAPVWGRGTAELRFGTGLAAQPEARYGIVTQLRPPLNVSADEVVLRDGAPTTLLMSLRTELVGGKVELSARPSAVEARLEPSGERRYKLHVDWTGPADVSLPADAAVDLRVGEAVVSLPVRRAGDPVPAR